MITKKEYAEFKKTWMLEALAHGTPESDFFREYFPAYRRRRIVQSRVDNYFEVFAGNDVYENESYRIEMFVEKD